MGNRTPPRTADGDRFRFRAGRSSLDLCATVLWRHVAPVELLREPADLGRWLTEAGLSSRRVFVTGDEFATVLRFREAAFHAFLARIGRRELPAGSVEAINAVAAHHGPLPRLTANATVEWPEPETATSALAAIAHDAIDLLTGPLSGRLRECAAPDCAFLFADVSRSGRRRWCAAEKCGNRQHVREYRARHKALTGTEGEPRESEEHGR
ncbi:ABATE domain-containing protein [Saccharomonospora sp. NPDC006951]